MSMFLTEVSNLDFDGPISMQASESRRPFEYCDGDFVVVAQTDASWQIFPRDSDFCALITNVPSDTTPAYQYPWLVGHSLCSGVAAFADLESAESYIATLARLHRGQRCNCGLCDSPSEYAP